MKKVLLASMFLLLQLAAHAQDTKYTVTLNVPEDGTLSAYTFTYVYGNSGYSRRNEFAAGEEVQIAGSLRSEYSCTGWTDESGTLVCDSLHYTFTMPARDVTLTGHTEYDPENPPGPREDGYTDTWNRLYLRGNPEYGGAFTWGLGADRAQNWLVWTGYEFTVQAYPNTGFTFVGWQLDGEIVSTDNPYTFIMPERDMTLYAMYDYDPETPVNPYANKWDKESGELIMTDFKMGHLYEAAREATRRDAWNSDWNLVKSATIAGQCTDESLTYDYPIDIRAITYSSNNVEYLDYSRTSGITKVPDGCLSKKSLKQIVLPATITTIGKYACRYCENLTTFTCFATTPPSFEGLVPGEDRYGTSSSNDWAFTGLTLDNIIVHVPAEAVPLYQEARGWKEFMILPITQGVQKLTVSLPQANSYKDMFLELVNTQTLQSQRYVITGATSYTFNNLIHDTQHTLYLKNQRGDILGTVPNIDIKDQDVQVSFADLKTPIDVIVKLMLPNGNYLPSLGEGSGVGITWTDRQGNYLGQGAVLPQQLSGTQVQCRVRLDETLGRQYQNPADTLFEVGQNSSLITYHLSLIPQVQLAGTVTAASTEKPVRNATVTVSQMLNDAYSVTQSTKTDIDGHWSLTVYDAPTTITVSHTDYLKATVSAQQLPSLGEGQGVGIALKDITGTIVDLSLSYTAAVADGEEPATEEGYDDADNIIYTVYDETHGQELTDIVAQYSMLVLVGDELPEETRLRITATSTTGDFMPISTTCTVDSAAHATAIFGIKEMGKLKASFEMTDNTSVRGVLYDGDGQLVGNAPYTGTELMVGHLKDGDYTLITMGYSQLFTSVSSLDDLLSLNGMDEQQMVKNEVTIRSGHITEVKNHSIPLLDEDRFRYTNDATSVTVNKSEVTVGSYVTVRAELGFKPAYVEALSKVRLQFDIPEGCEFVDNSMMVGNHTTAYEQDDRRITVLVENLSDAVRFCVVPTQGGSFEISAGTRFRVNGATTIQPIGAVCFTASDLTINVVEVTARRSIPVSGMAVPLSQVEIFDGSVSIGQTTSIGTGYYSVMCPLDRPYNLSEHSIYAVVTTPEGLVIQSETKTVEVNRGGLTPVVTGRLQSDVFEHSHFDITWDFRTFEATPTNAPLTTSAFNNTHQIYHVDFYDENDMVANDTTVVRDVVLYVMTTRGDIRVYPLSYSERHKNWWIELDWNDRLPINVDLDYTVAVGNILDRQELDDIYTDIQNDYVEIQRLYAELKESFNLTEADPEDMAVYTELTALLDKDELTDEEYDRLNSLVTEIIDDPEIQEEARRLYALDFSEVDSLLSLSELSEQQLTQIITKMDSLETCVKEAGETVFQITDEDLQWLQQEKAVTAALGSMMYDYVYDKLSLFYPDLEGTLPAMTEEGSYHIEADSLAPGRTFIVEKLTSVDSEQLIAEGYIRYAVTDGNDVYTHMDERSFIYIDTKDMVKRSIIVDEEQPDAALARRMANARKLYEFIPANCRKDWDLHVFNLKRYFEQMKDAGYDHEKFRVALANAGSRLKLCIDALGCMWEGGYGVIKKFIFEKFGVGIEEEIAKEVENIEKRKVTPNKKLAQCQTKLDNAQKLLDDRQKYKKLLERELKGNHLSPSMRKTMEDQLSKLDINEAKQAVKEAKDAFKPVKDYLKLLDEQIKIIKKEVKNIFKFQGPMKEVFERLPKNIAAIKVSGRTIIKGTGILGKVFGTFIGSFLQIIPLVILIDDNSKDIAEWNKLKAKVDAYYPCEGDRGKYSNLVMWFKTYYQTNTSRDVEQILLDGVLLIADIPGTAAWPVWLACRAGAVASFVMSFKQPRNSREDRQKIIDILNTLNCKPNHDPIVLDEDNPPATNLDVINTGDIYGFKSINRTLYWLPKFKNVIYRFDPSGYVYEAVNSNRVEGVTATCYYKETKEDMYGDFYDEAVIWDAAEYAQENPQFTDADGRYQWDVPKGLWQVKYEKQGYETTYSDWLPVPPPQLEVNVGITQMKQPNVAKVKAYENGIDITFDKYMRPNTLEPENIFLTKGGQTVSGKIELLNAESGYQTPDSVYASKLRFVPDNANLNVNDKVQLTVSRKVESYAGVPMEQDFTQQFTVEQRIEALVADSLLNMQEGSDATFYVKALPAAAAKGKTVKVTTSDTEAVSLSQEQVTLNDNGEAKVTLSAQALGTSIVRFTLAENDELTTTTLVTVRDKEQMQVAAPKSSRLNGTTLYIGSEIRLTCATTGATIFYTLNGVCPCDYGNKSIFTYDGPIVLTGDSIHIKAMAMAPGMEDSPVVEFNYKGIARPDGIEAPTVPDDSVVGKQPKLFFRLNGQRLKRPERGITIERQGSNVKKVVTK